MRGTKLMDVGTIENRVREAVKLYYKEFETKNSLTIHEVAAVKDVPSVEIHKYMAQHASIGMPDNREEAQKYLKILEQEEKSYQ